VTWIGFNSNRQEFVLKSEKGTSVISFDGLPITPPRLEELNNQLDDMMDDFESTKGIHPDMDATWELSFNFGEEIVFKTIFRDLNVYDQKIVFESAGAAATIYIGYTITPLKLDMLKSDLEHFLDDNNYGCR